MSTKSAIARTPADPEISAISKIGKIVASLSVAAQARVLKYVHERYCLGDNAPPAA